MAHLIVVQAVAGSSPVVQVIDQSVLDFGYKGHSTTSIHRSQECNSRMFDCFDIYGSLLKSGEETGLLNRQVEKSTQGFESPSFLIL